MSSAVPHLTAFLTRPLLADPAAFPPAAVTAAQIILSASLAAVPSASGTLLLSAGTPPPPALRAASLGAGIPWAAWLPLLAGAAETATLLVIYGPGYLKVRRGGDAAPVQDVWSEDAVGSVVRISRPAASSGADPRLRATLLSARARTGRTPAAAAPAAIRLPTLFCRTTFDSDSDSDSDAESDVSDAPSSASSAASSATACSSIADSPLATKPTALPAAAPARTRTRTVRPLPVVPLPPTTTTTTAPAKPTPTTAYLYAGGVTRVMSGGVMLGPRPKPRGRAAAAAASA